MDKNNLNSLRHSTAHLMAAAVLDLFPGTQNAIGPAVENGFYTDFDFGDKQISDDDLPKIEARMKDLVKNWSAFETKEVTFEEAKKLFKHNKYKTELIEDLAKKGEKITINNPGKFLDLCRGGHLDNPAKEISAFKLLSIAGAYWKGSEKNKMLTRIYGTAFPTKKELDEYLNMLEEAKKRDHRILGKELDLFLFSDLVGSGLPLYTPKGTVVREGLISFSEKVREKLGFQRVWSPHITKKELYETSGHWDKFGSQLFLVKSQETTDQLVMKPMNCPHHAQIYASRPRSYRELPIKYMETTTNYRDEKSGEIHGLSRVRSLSQDDSHAYCRQDQVEEIFTSLIEAVKTFYSEIHMELEIRLSFRDGSDQYLGPAKLWDFGQKLIKEIADKNELKYYTEEGEAAFYGPKIDFMAIDAIGRKWQVATIQFDFVQPERFKLEYTDEDGTKKQPIMIHCAIMGSFDRFFSVYIEHTAGAFPLWLAPVQVSILAIADRHNEFAEKVGNELQDAGIRVEIDTRSERLQAKIRDAALQKVPIMGIIGDKEMEKGFISARTRSGDDLGNITIDSLINQLKEKIDKKI